MQMVHPRASSTCSPYAKHPGDDRRARCFSLFVFEISLRREAIARLALVSRSRLSLTLGALSEYINGITIRLRSSLAAALNAIYS